MPDQPHEIGPNDAKVDPTLIVARPSAQGLPFEKPMHDMTGDWLGRYQLKERIGRGGMSEVYRAIQESLDREVALKVLSPSLLTQEGFMQRFENEARTVARLDHANILAVFDYGLQDGWMYLAMPLVRGGTLKDRLIGPPLELPQALRWFGEIADALQHAHDAGIIHRDLKPTNILLHQDGRSLLADFGLARSLDSAQLTMAGETIGTPAYMAPEQVLGKALDQRADLYALGVLLFQMLTGTMPYKADSPIGYMLAAVNEPIPSARARNAALPPEVDALLTRALAKDPDERPDSALELLSETLAALRGTAPTSMASVVGAQAMADVASYTTMQPAFERPPGAGSAVATLAQMGVPKLRSSQRFSLNSHFANTVRAARDACGDDWPRVASLAGLAEYLDEDPPSDAERSTPLERLSRLNEAFDVVFGGAAPEKERQWGRLATEGALSASSRRALKLIPGQQRKVATLLKGFTESMDEVRGEHLHTWKQIDQSQFWLVHYNNLYALGRRKQEKACHIWTATFETMLRWAGLANDWLIEEIECGCVTGSFDCVFAIRALKR